MNRIEREKIVVKRMIEIYCHHHLKMKQIPEEYQFLAEYANQRLDHCKFGEQKTACKKCPVHCYTPHQRVLIRKVMRWSGPRMLFYAPIEAIRHFLSK